MNSIWTKVSPCELRPTGGAAVAYLGARFVFLSCSLFCVFHFSFLIYFIFSFKKTLQICVDINIVLYSIYSLFMLRLYLNLLGVLFEVKRNGRGRGKAWHQSVCL